MPPNDLAGLALHYLIGKAGAMSARETHVVEVPFDSDWKSTLTPTIGYCNLLDEANKGNFGPYRPQTATARQYDEGVPDPAGAGFEANLRTQFERRRKSGFEYVELDNPDAYALADVMRATALAETYGLKVIAKNPLAMDVDATSWLSHPNVYGVIVERDAGTAAQMDALRKAAAKPDLPVWFVFFGNGRFAGEVAAQDITSGRYINMSATFDAAPDEYGGQVTDLVLPIKQTTDVSPMPQSATITGADIIAKARSLKGQIVGDSQQIVDMARAIGAAWADMASYVAILGPTTEWCGIFVAYVLTLLGIRPAYTKNSSDYDDFAWADAPIEGHWGTLVTREQARPGDIVVLRVPHHITILDADNGDGTFQGTGGNQGGSPGHVTTATFQWGNVRGIIRAPLPSGEPAPVVLESDPAKRPIIKLGDVSPYVVDLKTRLGLPVNANFDAATDAAVRVYQASRGLPDVDGEVGEDTWGALMSKAPAIPAPSAGGLPADVVAKIIALARNSPVRFGWSNGTMPVGCANGLAVSYAIAYRDLKAGTSAALAMARPLGDTSTDALAWYGVSASDPVALLRADFQLLFGSAMRESSGNYSEGVDTKAGAGRPADEIEAGLLQQSANSLDASPELPKLLARWRASTDDGLLSIFREGVTDLHREDFGSGDAALFQHLCKTKPLFAVYCAAIAQRVLRGHWGPISRHEAELRPEADALLRQVQAIVDAIPIIIPPIKPGDPMPDPTTVDEAMAKIRPIVAGVATSQPPSKEDIRKYLHEMTAGGGPVPLLPAPPAPPDPAAPVVTVPKPSTARVDAGVAIGGIGAALLAWWLGGMTDTEALITAVSAAVTGATGLTVPTLKIAGGAIQSGAAVVAGNKAAPPTPPPSA